jgi:hypothetical protein
LAKEIKDLQIDILDDTAIAFFVSHSMLERTQQRVGEHAVAVVALQGGCVVGRCREEGPPRPGSCG